MSLPCRRGTDMKVLVTFFDPFGGEKVNSAQQAAELLPPRICGAEIVKACVPTSYSRSSARISELLDALSPGALIMLGQASGRASVTLEKAALNFDSSPAPDNDGEIRNGSEIVPGGPDGIFSTLDVSGISEECRRLGLPVFVSLSAGGFVCNHLFYTALYTALRKGTGVHTGFVHLPAVPSQSPDGQKPSMLPERSAACVEQIIKLAVCGKQRQRPDVGQASKPD